VKGPFLVLVVEDNEANQMLARAVLEREGYRVEIAGAADEALEKVREKPPNLILMDIELPGQDGLSLARQLKAASSTANIPIIALTAYAMRGDREATIAAGCAGYIAKPIDTSRFGDQIREILAPVRGNDSPAESGEIDPS